MTDSYLFRFKDDETIQEWLSHQKNKKESLRALIHFAHDLFGNSNLTDRDIQKKLLLLSQNGKPMDSLQQQGIEKLYQAEKEEKVSGAAPDKPKSLKTDVGQDKRTEDEEVSDLFKEVDLKNF